jgi:hypothetical protein
LGYERAGAATGIAFVVLVLIATFIAPAPPPLGASAPAIATYYTSHRGPLILGTWLSGLAVIFWLWFLGSIRHALYPSEGGTGRLTTVAVLSGTATAAVVLVFSAIGQALAFRTPVRPGVVEVFYNVQSEGFTLLSFLVAAFVGAASLVMLRHNAVARWLGQLGIIVAVLQLIGTAAIMVESGPLGAGGAFSFVAFLSFLLWVLLLSVVMVLKTRARPAKTEDIR